MCKRLILVAAIVAALSVAHAGDTALQLYVAPNGNDAWSGTLPEPNAEGTDGPRATVAGARDLLREMKGAGRLPGPVSVQLRNGVYRVTAPIVFEPVDTGSPTAPITYEAYPGEHPVVSGGVPVTGWTQDGGVWRAIVPEAGPRPAPFCALWVNGEFRGPARSPNGDNFISDGTAPVINDPNTQKPVVSPHNAIRYKEGDVQEWQNIEDVLVVGLHSWDITKLPVERIDREQRLLIMKRPEGGWDFNRWSGPEQRYYVENILEGLDAPGEWYLERKTKTVSYIPKPGEEMDTAEVIAPVAQQLIVLQGDTAGGAFVEHLHFKGIAFYHTDYSLPPEGMNSQQAACSVNAAFQARGARNCSVEDCEIAHVSNYGVWFGEGCEDNLIARNHIHDLGAGGVRLGEMGDPATSYQVCRLNVADNNWIHDGGTIYHPAVGVWIGRSSYNTVSHNEIHDFYYTGVSVGWSWGYAPSSANHNIIEYNHIHHLGKRYLSDMGGIYLLGRAPGTVCRYNHIHDVVSYSYGGWGIYPDEGSSYLRIENNLVYNTKTGGFHQHYGQENRIENNIFAYSQEGQIQRTRMEEHLSFTFRRNIVYFNNGQLLSSNWSDNQYDLDFNCYWDESLGGNILFAGNTLEQWRAKGQDEHSLVADPLFENPQALDFHLKPDSPALGIGFEPIDTSGIGLYGDEAWVEAPKRVEHPPSELPAPFEPKFVRDDFEDTPPGAGPKNAATSGTTAEATILVTDETAAGGARSLKIQDKPGLDQPYNPHFFYHPLVFGGNVVGSFDIRVEPGVIMYCEWRSGGHPYKAGPRIHISSDGTLTAMDRQLLKVPAGQWFHVEIRTSLGKESSGAFGVTVTVPGQDAVVADGLPFGNSDFRHVAWLGFVADGDLDGVFYLDNIILEQAQP
ncbi:MAG TPA: right-handed parallel beta-helix repeat-containing protein [Candidatus Hydrogenedentes bacterium]|nr:right-handed parallel beta-helix repeat-containing protein [Candidatus Hydrogenedentota bacterium]